MLQDVRYVIDANFDFHTLYDLSVDAIKTTDQYDDSGRLKSHVVMSSNGYSDTQTFTDGVLTSEVVKFAPGGAEISSTKVFNAAGVLTSETQIHADKSKDVYLSNLTGKTYTAEHNSYNSAGTLVEVTRTHKDGTLDYHYVLANDGTKTTDQFDAGGTLKSHAVVGNNGYAETQISPMAF